MSDKQENQSTDLNIQATDSANQQQQQQQQQLANGMASLCKTLVIKLKSKILLTIN